MFVLKSKEQLEKAIAKSLKTRTQVKFISFGVYSVKGTKGNFYTVKCEKVGNEKQVSCECAGASKNLVCYHAASALSLHIGLARQRQTV
jgi:nucleoid DNA-binding protein